MLQTILMVPFGGRPYRTQVKDDFRAWRAALGGHGFEMILLGGVDIVHCDDCRSVEDQPNGCGLYGPYFFVGSRGEENCSLTEEQLAKCLRYWEARKDDMPPPIADMRVEFLEAGSAEDLAYREKLSQERREFLAFWESV